MNFDARTIKVTNLPLNIKTEDINNMFSKYGTITNLVVRTPKNSLWQVAYITYDSPTAITLFHTSWSRLVFNDSVRVYPCTLTKEEVNNRNNYRIKLTNLPFGTSARDLTDITRAINAKACYIPRSTNYKPKPFAILFFDKADALNDALKLNYAYRGNNFA